MQPPAYPPLSSAKSFSLSSSPALSATLINGNTIAVNSKLKRPLADSASSSAVSVAVMPESKIVEPAGSSKASILYSDLLESVTRWNAQANRQRRARMPYVDTVTGQPQRDNHLRQYRREERQNGGAQSGQLLTYPPQCRWRVEKRPYNYYYTVPPSQLRAAGGSTDDASAEVDEMLAAYEDHQLHAALMTTAAVPANHREVPTFSTGATGCGIKESVSSGVVAGILSGVELKSTSLSAGTNSTSGGIATRSSVTFNNTNVSGNGADDTKSGSTSTSGNYHHHSGTSRSLRQYSQEVIGDEALVAVLGTSDRSLMDYDDADDFGVDSGAKDDEEDDDYHGGSRRRGARVKRGGGNSTVQSKVRRMAADRTYPCQECGKIFKSRQGLRYHMQSCPPDGSAAGAPIESVIISSATGSVTTAATNRPRRGNMHNKQQSQPPPAAGRHSTPHSSSSSQHSGNSNNNVMPASNQQQPGTSSVAALPFHRTLPPQTQPLPQQPLPPHIISSHHRPPSPAGAFGRPLLAPHYHPSSQQYGSISLNNHQHIPSSLGGSGPSHSSLYAQQPLHHQQSPSFGVPATSISGQPSTVPVTTTAMTQQPLLNIYPQPPPLSLRPSPAPSLPQHQPLPAGQPHGMYSAGYPQPPSQSYLPAPSQHLMPPLSSAVYSNNSHYHHQPPHTSAAPFPPYHHSTGYGSGLLPTSSYTGNSISEASSLRPRLPSSSILQTSSVTNSSEAGGSIYPPPSLLHAVTADDRSAANAANIASESHHVLYASHRSNGTTDHNYDKTNHMLPHASGPSLSSSVFDDRHLAPPKTFCDVCKGTAHNNLHTRKPESMISCSQCRHSAHPTCLSFTDEMVSSIRTYNWQCIECKVCVKCGTSDNDDQLLFCDLCDRGYHLYCLKPPLKTPPEGKWFCELCQSGTRRSVTTEPPRQPQSDGNPFLPLHSNNDSQSRSFNNS